MSPFTQAGHREKASTLQHGAGGWLAILEGGIMAAKLTPKQQCFVNEYLIDLNATQAAIRAGYSEKTANRIGPQLLVKTCVSEAIQQARQELEKRTQITADLVLKELAAIALDDASDVSDSRLRYTNKIRALELLGKHLGMFKEKVSVEMPEGGVIMIPPVKDE